MFPLQLSNKIILEVCKKSLHPLINQNGFNSYSSAARVSQQQVVKSYF